MPRTTNSTLLTALAATDLQPALFVQMGFASETVYVWSGVGNVTWNGQTWAGLGSLLGLTPAEDAATVEARGLTITISGLDSALLSECLTDFQLGLPVTLYLGLYSGGSLISTPITSWSGRMDMPTVNVAGDSASIEINCESRLIDMNIAVDRRYTHEDQQMDNPGDLGLSFVNGIQEMTLFWGRFPASSNNL